jgi:hypothetical protein
MSEQPNDLVVEPLEHTPPDKDVPQAHHEHVRTEGETSVDDAIGTSDDPA